MRRTVHKGFTLVEILIVVVILGILAAIVIPQFANASSDALKGTLQTQLQTISSQIELYRVRENGDFPVDITSANNGWGDLITEGYLREEPRNGWIDSSDSPSAMVDVQGYGTSTDASTYTNGWHFDNTPANDTYGQVWAAGFDQNNNAFADEAEFVPYAAP